MKILLSPAKTLDFESKLPTTKHTQPQFSDNIEVISAVLKKLSVKKLASLMHISDNLSQLNYERNQQFESQFTTINSRPAIYAFAGDVYTGLDPYTLDLKHLDNLQDSVRILSGLYGYLKPLDLMQPYRLEMGTDLSIGKHKNLYAYWKKTITPALNEDIKDDELVVNLASNEYFKAIDKKVLKGQLISPVFKDYKNDKLKVISFFAKKARGTMARFLIENDATSLEDIRGFNEDNYSFSQEHTLNNNEPVFIR